MSSAASRVAFEYGRAPLAMNGLTRLTKVGSATSLLQLLKGFMLGVLLWVGAAASAHMMVAQNGTLNLLGDGAFLVASLPASAFLGVDDDGDGALSAAELRAHQTKIIASMHSGISLQDETGSLPLQGLMVNLASPDESPEAPATQLVVFGRFALTASSQKLRLRINLFGTGATEQSFHVKVLRGSEVQWLMVSPNKPEHTLFAPKWEIFSDFIQSGALHIFTGFDHLLFLLVVLASGWGWRHVLLSLSCFTVGHAMTLIAVVFGLLSVPAALGEPAIAATIVAMAGFDWRMRYMKRTTAPGLRMALVFFLLAHPWAGIGRHSGRNRSGHPASCAQFDGVQCRHRVGAIGGSGGGRCSGTGCASVVGFCHL